MEYNCVPLEVAVLDNRVHVECAAPAAKTRGDYPVDVGDSIRYFAVSLSDDPGWVHRLVQLAEIAITSGRPIRFSFKSGDYSGEAFECARANCRTPWAFALLKTTTVP
jgi:hypothetical protein